MLRMYSIMQLGHLWAKQPSTTSGSILTDDDIDDDDDDDDDGDDSILEVHPVAVETTDIQERQEKSMTTGYQASHQLYQYKKNTVTTRHGNQPSSSTTSFSSLALSTSSDPGTSTINLKNQPNVATFVHEEHREDDEDDNYDDDDDDDDSPIMKNDYYYYHQPTLPQRHQYNHYQRLQFNRPALQHLQIHPPYLDDLPPLTYDLTCITEENQSELNNSSMISSTGSLPKTPTSTVSTPLRRKRPEIKFNERRKNFTKKLKRVFTSKKKIKT